MNQDIFVPPGVQAGLLERLGNIPRQATPAVAAKLEALWSRRNLAEESELASIDKRMEDLLAAAVVAAHGRRVRVLFERHNLDGRRSRRHKVFVLRSKSLRNYWVGVTDVRCPCCAAGRVRWDEAGRAPGYRRCDGCKRAFKAAGNSEQPKLILL